MEDRYRKTGKNRGCKSSFTYSIPASPISQLFLPLFFLPFFLKKKDMNRAVGLEVSIRLGRKRVRGIGTGKGKYGWFGY